jgi:hypothetical protein
LTDTPVPLGADDLFDVVGAYRLSAAVMAMAQLGLPEILGTGAKAPTEIAEALGVTEPPIRHLLRMLASRGALVERADGRFDNSGLSDALRDPTNRDMICGWSALPELFDAWACLHRAVRGEFASPFEAAFGVDFHAYLTEHRETAAAYGDANASTVEEFEEIAHTIDLSEVRTVAVVGGLSGIELVPLLRRWPHAQAILTDLPAALEDAERTLTDHGLASRVEIVPGDARIAVPPADAYLLSTVLRCLRDDDAVAVLRACRRAGGQTVKTYSVEMVVPEGPASHPGATAELTAWVAYGGADRTAQEWRELHRRAGLHVSTITPLSDAFSLIEGVALKG